MLFAERANEFLLLICLSAYGVEAQGNRVLKGRNIISGGRPEARRAYHDQDEAFRNESGGPNPFVVQFIGMSCGKE